MTTVPLDVALDAVDAYCRMLRHEPEAVADAAKRAVRWMRSEPHGYAIASLRLVVAGRGFTVYPDGHIALGAPVPS